MIGDDKLFAPLPREQQSSSRIAAKSRGFVKHMGKLKADGDAAGAAALRLYHAKLAAKRREKEKANAAR